MPSKLAPGERTVSIEFKLPISLKNRALTMASSYGDKDVSSWLRELIRREWQRHLGKVNR